ncbi:MAG TPA: hypothetical protein VI873_02355, partial [Candidatus Peribacteraceae bacterium]|nr:hypothetical protein [Candidatus Peribacteraceae bacterium]
GVQRALPKEPIHSFVKRASQRVAELMNRDMDFAMSKIWDRNLCASITASRLPKDSAVAIKETGFLIDDEGFPVSSNETWNACIRGRVSLHQLRSNSDTDEDGLAKDCGAYHTGSQWRHPDLHIFFGFNRHTKSVSLPEGYFLYTAVAVASR